MQEYTVEDINQLPLNSIEDIVNSYKKIISRTQNFIDRIIYLEDTLKQEIDYVSQTTGIKPELPPYIAYLHLVEDMSLKSIANHFEEKGVELDIVAYGFICTLRKKFKIPPKRNNSINPESGLSNRELEILVYLSRGYSNREIGIQIGISFDTVKNHSYKILKKIRVCDARQAVIVGYELGWFSDGKIKEAFGDIPFHENVKQYLPEYVTPDLIRPELSHREQEILVDRARGYSDREIALIEGISHQTVKRHITHILAKLEVRDSRQAVIVGYKLGWFSDGKIKEAFGDIPFHKNVKQYLSDYLAEHERSFLPQI